jgi:flagellar biosynthesis/type III secretory pathway protein FliH
MLKQRELDLRAMDMQRRAETDALRINNQDEQFEDRLDFDKVKLETQDEQSDERLEVAREKMNIKNKGVKMGKKLGLDTAYNKLKAVFRNLSNNWRNTYKYFYEEKLKSKSRIRRRKNKISLSTNYKCK